MVRLSLTDGDTSHHRGMRSAAFRTAIVVLTTGLMALSGAGLGAGAAAAAPTTGTLDQTTTPTTDNSGFLSLTPGAVGVQMFTAGRSGVLTGVDLYPYVTSGYTLNNPVINVTLRSAANDAPTGPVLATGQFAATTTTGWETATIPTAVSLVAGEEYAISLSVTTGAAAFATTTYPNPYLHNGVNPNVQAAFQTYVDETRVAPTITGTPLTSGIAGKRYSAQYTLTGSPAPTLAVSGNLPPGVSLSDEGLLSGIPTTPGSYTFTPTASNTYGTASGSPTTITVRAAAAPGTPTGVTAVGGAGGHASVSWTPPASSGDDPITRYTTTASPGGSSVIVAGDVTTATVPSLDAGTAYTFTVTATNVDGTSGPSAPSNTVTPYTQPGMPASVTVTPGNGAASLHWTAPSNGYSPITGYRVQQSAGGGPFTDLPSVTDTSDTITGLTNGVEYSLRVAAVNAAGVGAWSATATTTPFTTPGTPTNLVTTAGDETTHLSWAAPGDTGGSALTGYIVQYRASEDTTWTNGPTVTGTAATVPDLSNGTSYVFRVAALNAAGTGPYSATVTDTPATVPGSPVDLTAVAGNATVALSWSAPTIDGGAVVTSYVVQESLDDATWTTLGTPTGTRFDTQGLDNGTAYRFRVAARNTAGTGSSTSAVTAVPATVPDAPTGLSGVSGDADATINWSGPVNDGGAAVTSYVLQGSVDGTSWTTIATPTGTEATVHGLDNGTAHHFRVAAVNSMGTGSYTASITVTPATTPNAPTALTATAGNERVALTWTAPVDDGGAPVSSYVVQESLDGGAWTTVATPSVPDATIDGLADGASYGFRVAAVNSAGTGTFSGPVTAVPATVPSAPTRLTVTPGDTRAALSWTAPSSDGGRAVSSYVVQVSSDGITWRTETSPTTTSSIEGLVNGTTYRFRVAAVNNLGRGAFSDVVTAALPGVAPQPQPHPTSGAVAGAPTAVDPGILAFTGSHPISALTLAAAFLLAGSGVRLTLVARRGRRARR